MASGYGAFGWGTMHNEADVTKAINHTGKLMRGDETPILANPTENGDEGMTETKQAISELSAARGVEIQSASTIADAKTVTLTEESTLQNGDEGKSEANPGDELAYFHKDTTKSKSDAIKTEQDSIEEYVAAMQENTESSTAKVVEIQELNREFADVTTHLEQLTSISEA